jgi:hypothetical protein
MTDGWRRRLHARRVRTGDGRPLPRFRWWQLLSRSLLTIQLPTATGHAVDYAVDIRQLGDHDDGAVRARLYRDGVQHALAKLPARFAVEGGAIEVAVGGAGIKRCHFVADDGAERLLTPHTASAEGRRARLDRNRPTLSKVIGTVATAAVLMGVVLALLQLVEPVTSIPPVREAVGVIESPLRLPVGVNVALGVATLLGSLERGLRLRSNWLDSLAN